VKQMLITNGFTLERVTKKVILPFESMDKVNKLLEKTFLKKFSLIVIIEAIIQKDHN